MRSLPRPSALLAIALTLAAGSATAAPTAPSAKTVNVRAPNGFWSSAEGCPPNQGHPALVLTSFKCDTFQSPGNSL